MAYNNYIFHGNENKPLFGVATSRSRARVMCADCGTPLAKKDGQEMASGDWLHKECLEVRRRIKKAA